MSPDGKIEIQNPVLTDKGWPRPWHTHAPDGERYPTPWVTVLPNFATIHPGRREDIVADRLCQICGEAHKPGSTVVVFQVGRLRDKRNGAELILDADTDLSTILHVVGIPVRDAALLHDRCARLAVKFCPSLRQMAATQSLGAFYGPIEGVTVIDEGDETSDGEPVDLLILDGSLAQPWR